MTESNSIQGTFDETHRGNEVYLPYVRVSVETVSGISKEFDGVIDTGSAIILVQMDLAVQLLGKREKEITRKRHDIDISGVGDSDFFGWAIQATIRLKGTSVSKTCMVLKDVTLYATRAGVPHRGILIGQLGALQDRSFVHLNYPNGRKMRLWRLGPKFMLPS